MLGHIKGSGAEHGPTHAHIAQLFAHMHMAPEHADSSRRRQSTPAFPSSPNGMTSAWQIGPATGLRRVRAAPARRRHDVRARLARARAGCVWPSPTFVVAHRRHCSCTLPPVSFLRANNTCRRCKRGAATTETVPSTRVFVTRLQLLGVDHIGALACGMWRFRRQHMPR